MSQLVETREEMEAKRKSLSAVFEAMGPEMDAKKALDAGVVPGAKETRDITADIKRRNDELTSLGQRVDLLAAQDNLREMQTRSATVAQTIVHAQGKQTETSPYAGKSIGQIFIESAAYKDFSRSAGRGPSVEIDLGDVELKALLDTTGYAIEQVRIPRVVEGALRRPVVADLFAQGTTGAGVIRYMEETTTTNAIATVAEGAAKPESTLAFTERNAPVRKIAGVLPVTDELIEDAPTMRSYIEARLRLFLQLTEEQQLLNGTGVAPQITGVTVATGVQTQAKGTDPTPDAVYKAMTLIRTATFLEPDAAVFHPTDWQDVRLLRTADGLYIWGAPMDAGPERIWGLDVVVTTAATLNTAVVGAFKTAAQIFRRSQVTFAISSEHSTFFTENKLMLRLEERLALAIYRPAAFCLVTGV